MSMETIENGHRWVIVGAAGFIGRALSRQLRERGGNVIDVVRDGGPGATAVGDFMQFDEWDALLQPGDIVVHLADPAHGKRRIDSAVKDGSHQLVSGLAEAVAHNEGRLVYMSSVAAVSDASSDEVIDEGTAPAPGTEYGRMKLANEGLLQESRADFRIIRSPLVYGSAAPGNFSRLERAVARGLPLPFSNCTNRRSFLSMENLVDGIVQVASSPGAARQTFNIADPEALSTRAFTELLAAAMQRRARLFSFPSGMARPLFGMAGKSRMYRQLFESLEMDCRKVTAVTGWYPPFQTADALVRIFATPAQDRTRRHGA